MLTHLFKRSWFPHIFQIVTFAVFMLLIMYGWPVSSNDSEFLITLRNTNLANLIVWSFWWPAIIVGSVLFGRIWCMVCPMELIATTLNRVGIKRRVPEILRTGWGITVLYAVVLVVGVHTLAIHRNPHRMAVYLLVLLGITVLVSLIFEKRAFCSYFCPVGTLLGLYALNSFTEWRVKVSEVCRRCIEKPCINRKRNYAWYGRPCQSDLFPGKLQDNRDCLLCTQCMKACPYDNIRFSLRTPFKDIFTELKLSASQAGLLLIVFGFALYEIVSEWKTGKAFLLTFPNYLNSSFRVPPPFDDGFIALFLFIIAPILLFMVISLIHLVVLRNKITFFSFRHTLYVFIPLIASSHFAKSIVKSVSRLQYIPGAINDTAGFAAAKALIGGSVAIGGTWQTVSNHCAEMVSIGVIGIGFIITLYLLSKDKQANKIPFGGLYCIIAGCYFLYTAGALAAKLLL